MASEKKKGKKVLKGSYIAVQKLLAGVSLLGFVVVMTAGLRSGVGIVTITVRAGMVMLVVAVIGRLVMQVLSTYEEINSGKA